MKTNNPFKKMLAAAALLLCLIAPGLSKAQIANPYVIYNNAACDVEVYYKIFDSSCNYVCHGSVTILAGSTGVINCHNPAPNGDDLYMVVSWIDNSGCPASQSQPATPSSNCYPGNPQFQTATASCGACTSVTIWAGPNYAKIF